MKNILFVLCILMIGCDNTNSEVDKILKAKQIVLGKINFPDTADFHEMKTQVQGNNVSLTVTAKMLSVCLLLKPLPFVLTRKHYGLSHNIHCL